MPLITSASALENRFGGWPSFHDAEVQAVRFDSGQRTGEKPSVELDIHVFAVEGDVQRRAPRFTCHTLVTFRFDGADDIHLEGFGPQNVLFDLVLEDKPGPGPAGISVSLESSNGLAGGLRCEAAVVIAVQDFVPGPQSVYYDAHA